MTEVSFRLILTDLFLIPWLLLVLYTIRPGGPEKSYEVNSKYALRLLPGRWKEKDFYVLWTRRLGFFWLIFFLVLYAICFFWAINSSVS